MDAAIRHRFALGLAAIAAVALFGSADGPTTRNAAIVAEARTGEAWKQRRAAFVERAKKGNATSSLPVIPSRSSGRPKGKRLGTIPSRIGSPPTSGSGATGHNTSSGVCRSGKNLPDSIRRSSSSSLGLTTSAPTRRARSRWVSKPWSRNAASKSPRLRFSCWVCSPAAVARCPRARSSHPPSGSTPISPP